jgi:hypothetical protein
MILLLDVDRDLTTGWEGFEYIVNRSVKDGSTTLLEKSTGGWNWEAVTEIKYETKGNELHLVIPKAALGITAASFQVDFKWLDNPSTPGEVMDLYLSGDTAPQGRFRYRYRVR